MRDFLGQEIGLGDFVVYPGIHRSSTTLMILGQIVRVDPFMVSRYRVGQWDIGDDGIFFGQRAIDPVPLKRPERAVVVPESALPDWVILRAGIAHG